MSFEQEDVQADSSTVETPEQSTPDSDPAPEASSASPEAPAKSEENVPFHLHPRFQEVIFEKKQLKEQNESFARELQELKNNFQKLQPQQPAKDELMERLKGIDPQFAERFGKLSEVDQLKQELAEFKQWREQSAAQQTQQQILSAKDKFYSENNVPADRRAVYEALAHQVASSNPKLTVKDLPQVMKQVHEQIGKMFQTVERATTKQFVEGKKSDAAKPASLKAGAPAKAMKKDSTPASRDDLLSEMRNDVTAALRGDKDI